MESFKNDKKALKESTKTTIWVIKIETASNKKTDKKNEINHIKRMFFHISNYSHKTTTS